MCNGLRVSVPDGNSLHSAQLSDSPVGPSLESKIRSLDPEDEKILIHWLEQYKDTGHPKFKVWKWLTTLDGLQDVSNSTPEWRQGRAELLLKYFGDQQRLALLHGAIDIIRAKNGKLFVLPEEEDDETMYFVVYQIIRVDPELTFQPFAGKQPVFMIAASQGGVDIVAYSLERLRTRLDERFATSVEDLKEDLFNKLKVPDGAKNTALGLAVGEGHAPIVRILLDAEKRLAGPDYLREDHIREAVAKCQIDIMEMVLDAQPDIAERLPKIIVQYGETRCNHMWTKLAPRFVRFLHGSDILHLAVQRGKLDIIDWLVPRYPHMVTRKDIHGRIALWYNSDGAIKESIRASIVPEIVRQCNPARMKELLRVANDTPRQASLDLRVFNQDTHDFAQFIELVKGSIRTPSGLNVQPDPTPNIKFESVLRYVHFPDLSDVEAETSKRERQEVPTILSWLRQKGVKRILRLVVPDCRANPLDEDKISVCLKDFEVEELDWRRLDLGIDPIASLGLTLSVLHLYSSGNWAVLSHWVSNGGLERLEELKELHIIIVQESMTVLQAEHCKRRTTDHMKKLKSRCKWGWDPKVTIKSWSHSTNSMQRAEGMISAADAEEKSASSSIKLDTFVNKYTDIQQARLERSTNSRLKPLTKVKIALIDTGIGALVDRSQLQIKSGISFGHGADGESESPWWIPSNEHGPQMADIISSIDPYCEIFPVKISDDTDGGAIRARPIIDAIRWAVDQHVDIISLSLVLFHDHKDLYSAVHAASQENIVIICSTADRGNNQQQVYPAQYWEQMKTDCLIPIAGCDQYGKLTDWSTETKAKYHFLGKDVTARSNGLMTVLGKEISGSSVATAIAAGTASLVLACSRLALEEENYTRKQLIEIFFEEMQTPENRNSKLNYVEPAIIFGEECIAGKNAETYIKEKFGPRLNG